MPEQVIIVGAGPAGVFAALACKQAQPEIAVSLLDREPAPLGVFLKPNRRPWLLTRELYDPAEFAALYPRGQRELLGPLHHFGPAETMTWLEERGLELSIDDSGGVYPAKDIEAVRERLLAELDKAGVAFHGGMGIRAADAKTTGGFWLTLDDGQTLQCDRLVLACGGLLASKARGICESFGHTVVTLAPSIFDLHTRDQRLLKANGSVVTGVHLQDDSGAEARGTVAIEPWGLGGPAVGELTSRAAESMRDRHYKFSLRIDWLGGRNKPAAHDVPAIAKANPRRPVGDEAHAPVPARLWSQMLATANVDPTTHWARLAKPELRALQRQLRHDSVKIVKRGAHQQEAVTCGGVALSEVDFRTMQSHLVPGLFFAGEILDLDGLPGGANLQACWTTGHLAGTGMAES